MTTTDNLIARAQAVIDAAEKMTPGPWTARLWSMQSAPECDDRDPMASIEAPSDGRASHRGRPTYQIASVDEDVYTERQEANATGIAILRNAAPAVIRDLLARLADQARGLTVGVALLDARFKPRVVVVEYREVFPPADGDTDPVASDIYQIRSSVDDGITYAERRKWYDGKSGADPRWQRWREPGIASVDDLARPCRLVPLADADRDPTERGPL